MHTEVAQSMATEPATLFDRLVEEGLAASRRDDTETALAAWRAASAQQPDSAVPHFLIAAEHAQAARVPEAEAAFATAVVLAPEFETARYQLGLLQYASGRPALALVTWERLFRLLPEHPVRAFVEGFAHLAADAPDAALERFAAGMALNRDNPPMNGDIAKVVAAIHAARGAAPAVAAPDSVDEEDALAHVLLGAYRDQQGPVH
jgi:tetratricopeptide (TPR) repeat protein